MRARAFRLGGGDLEFDSDIVSFRLVHFRSVTIVASWIGAGDRLPFSSKSDQRSLGRARPGRLLSAGL